MYLLNSFSFLPSKKCNDTKKNKKNASLFLGGKFCISTQMKNISFIL